MVGRIFINYRREDSRADARSIYQRLERGFGSRRLFMDVDTIQKGRDFTKVLDEHLARSDVMLAIIGSQWLSAQDEDGTRRLDNPEDFVRLEIASALKRDIPVIPVIVDRARMPKAAQLPDDLKPLARRQASMVTHENFARDVDGLARDLQALLRPSRHWGRVAAVALVVLIGLGVIGYQFYAPDMSRDESASLATDRLPTDALPETKEAKAPETPVTVAAPEPPAIADPSVAPEPFDAFSPVVGDPEVASAAEPSVAAEPFDASALEPVEVAAVPGHSRRFSLTMGSSALLIPGEVLLAVNNPDPKLDSVGIKISRASTRMSVGQEISLSLSKTMAAEIAGLAC